MLLFKKKFLDAIRSGEKTQTIRLWKHRMMKAGQRSYTPGVGPIRILTVDQVELDALNDADALRKELRDIYGEKLAAGYQAFRVTFEIKVEDEREHGGERGE